MEHRTFQKRALLAAACLTQPGRPYSSLVQRAILLRQGTCYVLVVDRKENLYGCEQLHISFFYFIQGGYLRG